MKKLIKRNRIRKAERVMLYAAEGGTNGKCWGCK